ncbi:MAG: cardiolipin synthase [Lachnospiraceae bacterium]|jgi:cardiolipin synthase|nr:cardiolipin synthase [Lachnospiraceae bacterium]
MYEEKKQKIRQKLDESQTLEKGRKGFFGILFGRTVVVIVLLLLQIALLFVGYGLLNEYVYFLNTVLTVLGILLVVHIINKSGDPGFKLVWIILILASPVFGALLYLFVELQPGTKWINRKLQTMHATTKPYWTQSEVVALNLERESNEVGNLARYVYKSGGFPTYQNSSVKYFPCGKDKFADLLTELGAARNFIFMEYFIVSKGYMWDTILEVLKRKVSEGVEVRFMYDGMCSLAMMPFKYPKKLEAMGIKCHMFSPVYPALSTHQNNRDHRKIVVIDGHTAFTGGINLADEYIDRKERFGYWKDTAVMIKGDSVKSFTLMFLEMWNVEKDSKKENFDRYLNVPQTRLPQPGDGFVMPYGDSPLDGELVGEQVYMDILYTAKKYVHIMTPYLIPDHDMITALTYAAKRGVEVIIIMPHIPDKWYAFVLAKTYYNELLDAGVQIYEFIPGFVHAKVFTSDDRKAVVGTINLDYRSLYLHFECAAYMYKNSEIPKIEKDFQDTLRQCQQMSQEDYKKQPLFNRIAGKVLRLFAPLM